MTPLICSRSIDGRFVRSLVLVATASLGLMLAGANAAADDLINVALTGEQAPDAESGVVFTGLGTPVLNASGQTAFLAELDGPGVNAANNLGMYSEGGGPLAEVTRTGKQAPGADTGVLFANLSTPLLSASGQTAFRSDLTGTGVNSTNSRGIYRESGGTLAQVARTGNQAPDANSGVVFSGLNFPVFNASGQTAFRGDLTGTGVANTNNVGVYSEGGGSLAEVARTGDPASGGDPGVIFSGLDTPVVNDSGQTAFVARLTGSGVTFGNNSEGVYKESGGSLAQVVRTGDQAPGADPGVLINSFFEITPVVNNSGHIAFAAGLRGTGVDSTNNRGIYSETGGPLAEVAREGGQAPDAVSGVLFHSLSEPLINSSGQTVFAASLTGTGVISTNDSGIYREIDGAVAEVAREGDQAPDAESGVAFGSFGFSSQAFNALGQIAFSIGLTGTGVDATNDRGLYATDLNGLLVEIIREGELLDVDDDPLIEDLRTVSAFSLFANSGNEDGRLSGFNDLGQVAFQVSFTDGSQGIFISNLVAIPEPASISLIALGMPLLLRRRR
ncbi:MAG: choice-of-anchor tandem repeat NxxGxxAF-containing protein [Planctomycetota bacterium]